MQRHQNRQGWNRSDGNRPVLTHLRKFALCALLAAFAASLACAQSAPSAFQDVRSIWVGGECSSFSASFPYQSGQRVAGCGAFVDVRWTYHLALEGDLRWLVFGGYAGSTEHNYLIGPRYIARSFGNFEPYGKFLFGGGTIHYPYEIGNDNYLSLAPSGGVDYRATRRLTLRAEYEYQFWLDSPGFADVPKHPLHPNGVNVGVSYRLLHF